MINKSFSSLGNAEAMQGMSNFNAKDIGLMGILRHAFSFVVGIASLPLRLFLRKNIGERSINFGTFLLSIALHIYYFTIFDVLLVLGVTSFVTDMTTTKMVMLGLFGLVNPYFIFLLLVLIAGIKHFKQKIREGKNNETGYTYFRGQSKYFDNLKNGKAWGFEIDNVVVRMIVEPRTVFKIGLTLFFISLTIIIYLFFVSELKGLYAYLYVFLASLGCTGLVLAFDSICLFIDEFSLFMNKRDKTLDMLDGQEDVTKIVNAKTKIEEGRKNKQLNNNPLTGVNIEDDVVSISNSNDAIEEEIYV